MRKDAIKLNKKLLKIFLIITTFPTTTGFFFFPSIQNNKYINQYTKAKKEKDCETLNTLSQNENFSLKDLAHIQTYKLCLKIPAPDFQWNQFPNWLQQTALEAWFHRASQNDDTEDFIKASFTLSKFSSHYEEKLRYIHHAIKLARKSGSPEKQKLIEYLYKISPSHNPKPQFKDYIAVAKDYKKRHDFKNAIYYYKKILNSKQASISTKQECFKQLKWLYKVTNQREKYLKAVSEFNTFQKRHKEKHLKIKRYYWKNQITLARNYWNSDKTELALQTLHKITQSKEAQPILDEVYWLIGKIYEEQNQYQKAIEYFKKGEKHFKKSDIYSKLLWSIAWNARRLRQYDVALPYLEQLELTNEDYSPQTAFWKAQVLQEMGHQEQSQQKYRELINEAPFSFHGIIAHYKLKKPLSLNLISIKPSKDDPYKIVDDLSLAEEKELILQFVKYTLREKNQLTHANLNSLLQLFRRSVNLGIYLPFFQYVGNLPVQEKSQFMKNYAYTLFPIIYQQEVSKASHLFNTPTEVIYSIIRQESAFNPRALSPANAAGLMQILPSVAREVAQKKAISFRRFHDLYNPKTNILLGTAHFQDLIKRYGSSLILNVARYNAGHRPVHRWLQKYSTTDPIEFIQNIPYKETQLYVRLIIRNFILYKLLEDGDNKIYFPEDTLLLPHSL